MPGMEYPYHGYTYPLVRVGVREDRCILRGEIMDDMDIRKYPVNITVKGMSKLHKRWKKMMKKACAATMPAIQKAMRDILDYQHD